MVVSGSLLTAGPSPNQFARSTTTWWSLACRSAPPSLLAPLRYSASFLLKPIFKDRSGTPWPTSTSMWPGSASRHSSSSSGLWHSHTGDGDKSRLVGVPKSSATSDLPPSILPAPKRKRHCTLTLHQLPRQRYGNQGQRKRETSPDVVSIGEGAPLRRATGPRDTGSPLPVLSQVYLPQTVTSFILRLY